MKIDQLNWEYIKEKVIHTAKVIVLSIGFTISLTACSFSYTKPKDSTTNEYTSIEVSDLTESISSTIDNTDWNQIKENNAQEVNQLTEDITQAATEFTKKEVALGEFQQATLIRVVDGDTIVVDINGTETSVRLIGVNTPESVASEDYLEKTGKENTKEGKDASEYTKALLNGVNTVYLQQDVSDTDRYNRLLRYVWLEIPTDDMNLEEISNKMLNGILLRDHVAEVATYEPDTAHEKDFEEIYELH